MKALTLFAFLSVLLFTARADACGWFLMRPPKIDPAKIADPLDIPISKWIHVASFDTAKDCEKQKERVWATARCVPVDWLQRHK
jgi:hypothetical protein